jgi:sulfite exporter TauE/SafE
MAEAAGKAFLLALATGLFCLGTCAPVLAPLMLGEERRGLWPKLLPFLQFSLGRLLAYAGIGALAGWAGGEVSSVLTPRRIGVSFMALALLMILYGLKGGFPQWRLCRAAAPVLARIRAPFWFGLLLGFNICPPFLAAMADVFLHGRAAYGLAFFLIFFLVTTLILLPLVLLGWLSSFLSLRAVGQWAAVIVGLFYFLAGLKLLSP